MLFESVKAALENNALMGCDEFRPLPDIDDRKVWEALDPEAKAYFEGKYPELLSYNIPFLPASLYAEFCVNGNRSHFEDAYFSRRRHLFGACIEECIHNDGRLIEKIGDLMWAICEETTWVIPAHTHQAPNNNNQDEILVDVRDGHKYIDLFSAETASVLSWCVYLMRSRFADRPMIIDRVEYEIRQRVLDVFLARPEMHWTGLIQDRRLNNWTPWIYSNILATMLLNSKEQFERESIALLVSKGLDKFLDSYPADGGCDEGPGYFNCAGASVLDTLELFDLATNGAVDIYNKPLIQAMSGYIMYAHIAGNYYINFADAACRTRPDCSLLLRSARRMGFASLECFAQGELQSGRSYPPYFIEYNTIFRRLRNLTTFDRSELTEQNNVMPISHYFNGIQVAFARENSDCSGLYVACKGGHNDESHNHNDIGSYIMKANGAPVIVDVGPEPYRKETFSDQRYSIWVNQSRYHSTAVIGGHDQQAGRDFAAKDARFTDDMRRATFSCDISGAYGEDAHVEKYLRRIELDRARSEIHVSDTIKLASPQIVMLPLMCAEKPEISEGEINLGNKLSIKYDPKLMMAEFEEVELKSETLRLNWQRNKLYRLIMLANDMSCEYSLSLTFKQ